MRTTRIGATGIVCAAGARVAAMTGARTATVAGAITRAGAATGTCVAATTHTTATRVTRTSTRTSAAACACVSTGRVVAGVRVATSACDGVVGVQVHAEGVELRSARVTGRQEVGPRTR